MHKEHLIISPGKSDVFSLLENHIQNVFENPIQVHLYRVGWRDNTESFSRKMDRFLRFMDRILEDNDFVSLGGISASASFMINAYMEEDHKSKK